jgi:hypothetical protein
VSFRMDIKVEKVLEEGLYDAILEDVVDFRQTFDGVEQERLRWIFRIPDEDDATVVGFSSMSPSTKGKAFKWASAINPEINPNTSANWGPEDIIGKECRVMLEVAEDAQGIEKNRVERVIRAKGGANRVENPPAPDFSEDLPD